MGGLSSAVEDVSTGMSSLRFDGSSYLSRTPKSNRNYLDYTISHGLKNIVNRRARNDLFDGSLGDTFDLALLSADGKIFNKCWKWIVLIIEEQSCLQRHISLVSFSDFEMNTNNRLQQIQIYVNSMADTLFI